MTSNPKDCGTSKCSMLGIRGIEKRTSSAVQKIFCDRFGDDPHDETNPPAAITYRRKCADVAGSPSAVWGLPPRNSAHLARKSATSTTKNTVSVTVNQPPPCEAIWYASMSKSNGPGNIQNIRAQPA
jgi:hypothetical protein